MPVYMNRCQMQSNLYNFNRIPVRFTGERHNQLLFLSATSPVQVLLTIVKQLQVHWYSFIFQWGTKVHVTNLRRKGLHGCVETMHQRARHSILLEHFYPTNLSHWQHQRLHNERHQLLFLKLPWLAQWWAPFTATSRGVGISNWLWKSCLCERKAGKG